MGGQRCVTPRQTCPRPNGFGRNLRSKTRWFTGFCNSHQVSHFAAFFIDARAEISVAESHFDFRKSATHAQGPPFPGAMAACSFQFIFLGATCAGVGYCASEGMVRAKPAIRPISIGGSGSISPPLHLVIVNVFAGRSAEQVSTMILPQVHLRKPCYDFSFL